jgi:hypothetical protein
METVVVTDNTTSTPVTRVLVSDLELVSQMPRSGDDTPLLYVIADVK